MYFKHLRGKHDQKDHGREGGTRSGGSRSGGARSGGSSVSFDSLSDKGLKGWARYRPEDPPDYSSFDAAVRGDPGAFRALRATTRFQGFSGYPVTFRDVAQTPEGEPVRMIVPDQYGASPTRKYRKMDDLTMNDLTFDDPDEGNMPFFGRSTWQEAVYDGGEQVFSEQRSENDAFWEQSITIEADEGRRNFSLDQEVRKYGDIGFAEYNAYVRRGDNWADIQEIDRLSSDLRNPSLRMTGREIQRNLTDLQRLVTNVDELRRGLAVIDSGMRPVPEHVFVRRGVGVNTFQRMQANLQVGDQFTDDALISTSINPTFNWQKADGGNSPMVNVILTEGTPALWTDGHAMGSLENEVIIGRGTRFEVISTDSERGWILRTIPPDGDYVPPEIPDLVPPEARELL